MQYDKQGREAHHRFQPLSRVGAEKVIRRCLDNGRVEYHQHLAMRMQERDFDSVDMERVFRSGCIYEEPEHGLKHQNWLYKIRARLEGCWLEIVVVIDDQEDYETLPLIIPVTGYWTGEGTGNGKRTDRDKERSNRGAPSKKVHD